jgi:D-alanine-D-alanine ligase
MGGISSEREVSIASGIAVTKALEKTDYIVTTIDVNRDLKTLIDTIEAKKPLVVFNALHGRFGEDGSIQGILDIMNIPYTHSGICASALSMNKPIAKSIFASVGIRVPDWKIVKKSQVLIDDVLPRPYVIKPLNEGSSVGIYIVSDDKTSFKDENWSFGNLVLVERFIPGRELTVSVMGNKALAVTEIISEHKFYDYKSKYTLGKSKHIIPAPLPTEIYKEAMQTAIKAHQTLGCRGISRADFRYDDTEDEQGKLYLLEVNTQPGMTLTSLVPEQAIYSGINFTQLVTWMVENAQCDG